MKQGEGAVEGVRKLKILCLHGYLQNGALFKNKTGSLRKALRSRCEFVFADGPHSVSIASDKDANECDATGSESTAGKQTVGPRAWFVARENAQGDHNQRPAESCDEVNADPTIIPPVRPSQSIEYVGWDESKGMLQRIIREEQIDGVLGFSQGALAAALLLAESTPTLQFGIIIAGFWPRDPSAGSRLEAAEWLQEAATNGSGTDVSRPAPHTLHIHGDNDRSISRQQWEPLVSIFPHAQRETFQHGGGHGIPTGPEFRSCLRAFVGRMQETSSGVS